jgi:hypothetical protein
MGEGTGIAMPDNEARAAEERHVGELFLSPSSLPLSRSLSPSRLSLALSLSLSLKHALLLLLLLLLLA